MRSFAGTVSVASFGVISDAVFTALSTCVQPVAFSIPLDVSFTGEVTGADAALFAVSLTMGGRGLATSKRERKRILLSIFFSSGALPSMK